jgi:hypothetical protein
MLYVKGFKSCILRVRHIFGLNHNIEGRIESLSITYKAYSSNNLGLRLRLCLRAASTVRGQISHLMIIVYLNCYACG